MRMHFYQPEEYQPKVARLYGHHRARIREQIPDARVEHVGASAIPGALSKGDLDIYVGVEPAELDRCIPLIESLGFRVKADTLRAPNLCMLESLDPDQDVAVQLVGNGSSFEKFLHFRDLLCADPQLLRQYNQMKEGCQGWRFEDYLPVKWAFIERVLASTPALTPSPASPSEPTSAG